MTPLLERIRHARRERSGWRKWMIIAGQSASFLLAVFVLINLALSLMTFRGEDPLKRTIHELQVLWFSPPEGRPLQADAFATVYGGVLDRDPTAQALHAYFEQEARDGAFLLDHVMTDHLVRRFGRIDSRALPAGVYVGAHALGPDDPPLVHVTKYAAHYLLFPRHAYILVVPASGPAQVFSASQNAKFGDDLHPERLSAVIAPFDSNAYDYPGSGQALHELVRITADPERTAAALPRLIAAEKRLEASGVDYGLLAPNSNTVVGCILEDAGVVSRRERGARLLALRAPGFGADCPDV